MGFPGGSVVKESACQCRRHRFNTWIGKIPWRRKWQLSPVFLPGKSHRQKSLVDYSPRSPKRVEYDLAAKQQQALLQGIFPTQGSNPGLPHCRWILYHLSQQGSPKKQQQQPMSLAVDTDSFIRVAVSADLQALGRPEFSFLLFNRRR